MTLRRQRVAVLMTCHNRRELTRRSLSQLVRIFDSLESVDADYYVVDDGSSDGTADAITEQVPDAIVLRADGNRFWTGGMRLAYGRSLAAEAYDAYLLINDDVDIDVSAASRMLSYWTSHADRNLTLVGATRSSLSSTELTYGGFDETSRMKLLAFNRVGPIDGVTRPCDTFNGNFVIVGGQAMTAVGGFSKLYVHGFGDLDLGLRLKAYGCPPEVYYEYIGVCDRGPTMATMVKRKAPRERIKALVYRQYGIHQEIYFGWQHRPKIMLPAYFLLGLFRRIKYVLG